MTDFKFKPEDFADQFAHKSNKFYYAKKFCEIANKLLAEHIASLPKVYKTVSKSGHGFFIGNSYRDTYEARLWGVKEIEK